MHINPKHLLGLQVWLLTALAPEQRSAELGEGEDEVMEGREGKRPLALHGAGKGSDQLSGGISCTLPPQLSVRVGIKGKGDNF